MASLFTEGGGIPTVLLNGNFWLYSGAVPGDAWETICGGIQIGISSMQVKYLNPCAIFVDPKNV